MQKSCFFLPDIDKGCLNARKTLVTTPLKNARSKRILGMGREINILQLPFVVIAIRVCQGFSLTIIFFFIISSLFNTSILYYS